MAKGIQQSLKEENVRHRLFMKILLGGVLVLLLTASNAFAKTYYVNYSSGSDTKSGSDISNAFKHCPGDSNATGTASDISLAAGDTVLFKGGVVYKGQINVKWSGSSVSPITYDGNSSGNWGTGKAIIDGANKDDAIGFTNNESRTQYIVIKNFEIREMGGYPEGSEPSGTCASPVSTAPSGVGVIFYTASNITLKDLYIHECGNWLNRAPFEDGAITGGGISLQDVSAIVIDNVEMTKMHTGISIKAKYGEVNGVEVKNSNIHDYLVWGIDVGVRSSDRVIRGLSFHDNKIENLNYYDNVDGGWAGCDGHPHSDYVFIRNDYSGSTFSDIEIYRNRFAKTNGLNDAGTAAIYLSNGTSATIYNNEFLNIQAANATITANYCKSPENGQTVKILNNTFYGGRALQIRNDSCPNGNFEVRNNIFVRNNAYPVVTVYDTHFTSGSLKLNNNQYYRTDGSTTLFSYNGGYDSWETVTNAGYEKNGNYGDPKFQSVEKDNFKISADSPIIDKGVSFSTVFTADKEGISRPQGNAWDIGAHEYTSSDSDSDADVSTGIAAPKNFKLIK